MERNKAKSKPKQKNEVKETTLLPIGYEPSEFDVVGGRGKGSYLMSGNKKFRAIVQAYVKEHEQEQKISKRINKMEAVKVVIERVRSQNNNCALFIRGVEENRWKILSESETKDKVWQQFRTLLDPKKAKKSEIESDEEESFSDSGTHQRNRSQDSMQSSAPFRPSSSFDISRHDEQLTAINFYRQLEVPHALNFSPIPSVPSNLRYQHVSETPDHLVSKADSDTRDRTAFVKDPWDPIPFSKLTKSQTREQDQGGFLHQHPIDQDYTSLTSTFNDFKDSKRHPYEEPNEGLRNVDSLSVLGGTRTRSGNVGETFPAASVQGNPAEASATAPCASGAVEATSSSSAHESPLFDSDELREVLGPMDWDEQDKKRKSS